MKKSIALLSVVSGALVTSAAGAAGFGYGYSGDYPGFYLGASAGQLLYDESGLPQITPTILLFRAGEQFSPYVGIEGRIGTSVNGGDAYGFHVNAQALYAGYVKGILPVSPWVSPYAIAGVAGVQWHRNYSDFDSNDAGLSFGFGAEFNVGGGASIDLEWVQLLNANNAGYDYTADQVSFGVNWRL